MTAINNWWKTTFGKTYFYAFVPTYPPEQTKKEVSFIVKNLHLKKGAKILDIPCGQGRHSIELAHCGFKVIGIDYSSRNRL